MGNRNGQVIGFQRLIVAIDSFDELVETNEANNLKAFACGEIPLAPVVTVETTETSVTTPTEEAAVESVSVPGNATAPNAAETTPVETTPSNGDPLRSAIRMIDNMSSESESSS